MISAKLREELYSRNIYSKFSVIGLGEHEASLLGVMAEIGTQRGLYVYIPEKDMEGVDAKIEQFFNESYFEMNSQPGLVV